MATKLERLGEELEKARVKYAEWGRRVKDLEERYSEEENSVIHTMVHAANLTPEQLAQIIAMATQGNVGTYSHILDDDRKANAELFENAFYSGKVTATEVEEAEPEEPVAEAAVPAGVDPELLMKLLANPEMAALLKTLAQTIK